MAHLYKSRLQTYAQKRNIALPMYMTETKGPPHSRLFKSQVTIDGQTYVGPDFSTTLKEAEHAAAKVAFMSLTMEGAQEDDCMYKSVLQELAQKRGLVLPVYVTNRTGPPHSPCFVSTVEISGQSYVGEEARTKKQSEMNAAKVAYTALTEGGPRANNATTVSNIAGTSSSGSSSLQTVTVHKNEPSTSKMQTIINNRPSYSVPSDPEKTIINNRPSYSIPSDPEKAIINNRPSYSIPSDPEKAKGYLELKDLQDVIEMHTMVPPIMIRPPQPQSTPNVSFTKPDIKQKNHVIQAGEGSSSNGQKIKQSFNEATSNPVMVSSSAKTSLNVVDVPKPSSILTNQAIQASEGPGSNGKKIQPFVNKGTLNPVMDLGSAKPQQMKILIRPHVQGMTYDGPIQVSDDEWVAMKVNANVEM